MLLLNYSLKYYVVIFFVSCYGLCFEVHLSDVSISNSAFFFTSICTEYFFPSLHFQLVYIFCSHMGLLWSGYMQVLFCYLFSTLSLLIGPFNPFTFKVIIDRYLFMAIFSLCTCVPLSLPLFLLLIKAAPLASLIMPTWWRCTLSAFFCLENCLFLLPF